MANLTNNSLFIASALVLIVGLLFLAYPLLTLAFVALCAVGHTYYRHSAALGRYYAQFSAALWPPNLETGSSGERPSYASTLLRGVDLPSPIPHVPSGLETTKNRRSPVDEIVSSTPRSSPTSGYGSGASLPLPMRSTPTAVASESRQLNFGRINTPKSSRPLPQEAHQNHVESNVKQRSRPGSGKTVQTTAGPLLPSGRYNPSFDAGIYVNVNSPGFTDRLVRCASDTGLNWSQTNLATQQDRYNSVGLFPIVHLNAPVTSSLSPKNSLKAPHSSVRVRIAPPAYSEQRQLYNRGVGPPMKSYVPTREVMRRNDVAKSVLESLQEASRKRIYSQCQEVLEDDSGKKRQRKGDTALPNPNCDMYQYRHIRAPPVPSTLPMMVQNDMHFQGKRMHDDPLSRANEPKRQRQQGKTFPANNEITSSLSSSKTLLQRLSGNKRKADDEYTENTNGKHFKESVTPTEATSSSRWLHSRPCDEGESSARTQEVVRTQKRPVSDGSSPSGKHVVRRVLPLDNREQNCILKESTNSDNGEKTNLERKPGSVETDLASKLFRKDVVSRSHPKTNISEKKGSSWTQAPPDADEGCLLEQSDSSELERPERFQSLLSRMCGPDYVSSKNAESVAPLATSDNGKSISTTMPSDSGKDEQNKTSTVVFSNAVPPSLVSAAPHSTPNVLCPEPVIKLQPAPFVPITLSSSPPPPPSLASVPQVSNPTTFTSQSFSSSSGHVEKANLIERQDKTDGQPSCPLTTASTTLPAAKPMFSFSPPSSLTVSQSVPTQTAVSTTTSTTSTVSVSSPPSFSPSLFKFISSPPKSVSDTVNKAELSALPQPILPVSSNPSTAPSQVSGFTFMATQPQSAAVSNSTSGVTGPISTTDFASKFPLPGQNLQFSSSSGSVLHSLPESQLNGPKTASALPSPPSSFQILSPVQLQASHGSINTEGKKSSLGDINFSGSPFGQTNSNGTSTAAAFSFTSVTTTSSTSAAVVSDSKSTSGGGSITFGTVIATQPTKPLAFTFSSPTQNNPTSENSKASLPFGGTVSTGFSNSQGLFNGFSSGANSTASAAPTFGSSPSQHQGSGGFSFGNTSNQPPPTVTFGAAVSAPMFGDRAPQQSSFSTTTTAGFSLQSSGPAFSSSPFGSFTSNSVTFGSQQPASPQPGSSFGSQTATSNAPSFGPSPSNPAPSFGSSSAPSIPLTFGAPSQLSFGASPPADSSFGANPSAATSASVNSSFNFGAEKPAVPAFNFGGNNVTSGSTFSFGSSEQPLLNSGNPPFQFGQATSPSSAPPFQFGSPSGQPPVFNFGGTTPSFGTATNPAPIGNFTIGGFSMGSGPTTPQRTRSLQTRRRRI